MPRNSPLLVVDDNAATRYAMRRVLERHGYPVMEAGTGGEGLTLLAKHSFAAVILDVNLPDMSGFDIVRQLRKRPETRLLPVIHVSAASIETGDLITGLDAGADAYLIHPVDPDVLLATLRTLLRVRAAEDALLESDARFREIFTSTVAPIAVVDSSLVIHEANEAFVRLLDGAVDEGRLPSAFEPDQAEALVQLRSHLADRRRWRGTLSMRIRDVIRHIDWRIAPYRAPDLRMSRSSGGANSATWPRWNRSTPSWLRKSPNANAPSRSSIRRRRWMRWASSPVALRTTSTIY
jgi:DNA-binding response OmpR family regulator